MRSEGIPVVGGEKPALTFVMAAYNAESTVGRAIESVLSQTIDDWELVVVDDGSTDGTLNVIQEFSARDARVRVESSTHLGVAAARNTAVRMAVSDYVAFVDSDDEVLDLYAALLTQALRDYPEYEAYACNSLITREAERVLFAEDKEIREYGLEEFLGGCAVPLGGALIKRSVFLGLGGFSGDSACEDYDLWLRLAFERGRVLVLPDVAYIYHQEHEGSRSSDHVAGADSAVIALERLVDRSRSEAPQLTDALVRALLDKQALATEARRERALREQAAGIRSRLSAVLGSRAADRISRFASRHAIALRPIRALLLRMRGRASR